MVPVIQKSNDIFIVEFPKSGITWLSTIIANINLMESGLKQRATYYNIQQLIPDIHISRNISDKAIWPFPNIRFIKSHFKYCPLYKNIIYLVRNPVSVLNSYYNFTISRKQFKGSFKKFINDSKFGIEAWIRHVDGWMKKNNSQRMHVIKFEELKDNPIQTIRDLYTNLGIMAEKNTIENAIELANITNMKISEKHYNNFDPGRKVSFIGKGESKTELVNPDLKREIIKKSKHILISLGYDIDTL